MTGRGAGPLSTSTSPAGRASASSGGPRCTSSGPDPNAAALGARTDTECADRAIDSPRRPHAPLGTTPGPSLPSPPGPGRRAGPGRPGTRRCPGAVGAKPPGVARKKPAGRPSGRRTPGRRRSATASAWRALSAAQVRSMVAANDADGALALGLTLEADPTTADVGHLAAGIVAGLRGYQALAWRELSTIPIDVAARWAPEELVRSGLGPGSGRGRIATDRHGRRRLYRAARHVVAGDDRPGLRVRELRAGPSAVRPLHRARGRRQPRVQAARRPARLAAALGAAGAGRTLSTAGPR